MSAQPSIDRPFTQLSVNITSTTDVLAAPSATQQYLIYAINLQSSATLTIQFSHGTGPTTLEGARTMVAGVPLDIRMFPDLRPRYTCGLGNKFTITQTGAGTVSGSIYYTLGPI